jgi:hypothetical protein
VVTAGIGPVGSDKFTTVDLEAFQGHTAHLAPRLSVWRVKEGPLARSDLPLPITPRRRPHGEVLRPTANDSKGLPR